MTLEDFFTLTEMKDGLTALSRVEELITAMKKENDNTVKNVGDTTRQWSAVASTIALTESKDCLDQFVRLDGLSFINKWLEDVQKFGHDKSDSSIEETITALLRALERLQIDKERSVSSGVWVTIQGLCDHSSTRIQDRANALFDSWKPGTDSDAIHDNDEKVGMDHNVGDSTDEKHAKESGNQEDVTVSGNLCDKERDDNENSRIEILHSEGSDNCQPDSKKDEQVGTKENESSSQKSDCIEGDDRSLEDPWPPMSPKAEFTKCSVQETNSTEASSPPSKKKASVEESSGATWNYCRNDENLAGSPNSLPDKMQRKEVFLDTHTSQPQRVPSSADAPGAMDLSTEVAADSNGKSLEGGSCVKSSVLCDASAHAFKLNGVVDNTRTINSCTSQVLPGSSQGDELTPNASQAVSDTDGVSGKPEILESNLSGVEVARAVEDRKHSRNGGVRRKKSKGSGFYKFYESNKCHIATEQTTDTEFDYGYVDALEVARQVAQEVEREVVDYREASCSLSSGGNSEGQVSLPGSPDIMEGPLAPSAGVPVKEVQASQDHRTEVATGDQCLIVREEEHLTQTDNLISRQKNAIHDTESSVMTTAAQEPEAITNKGICGFDLNQEISSDDMHLQANPISIPFSDVSALRSPASSVLPAAPLQYEVSSGWKGSAHNASSSKIPGHDVASSTGEIDASSKQRRETVDFDLNVAEGEDEKITDQIVGEQIPVSSVLLSGQSTVAQSPRKSERVNLDLNRISDDGDDTFSGLRIEERNLIHRNRPYSPSSASSSSLPMQTSLMNIDLNNGPPSLNDCSRQVSYSGTPSQAVDGRPGSDGSVIFIMGAKVEIPQKGCAPRSPSLPNKTVEPMMNVNVNATKTREFLGMVPAVSYPHSPLLGYNGLVTNPTSSFSPAMYGSGGSMPYLVDSRGPPAAPHIMGSVPTVPPYSRPPFIMSMSGALTGPGPLRPGFDLNSGILMEANNQDTGDLRHPFMSGQTRLMEDQLRAGSQSFTISEVGGKRKEPDSNWEAFQLNYKHQQPPWK